MSYENARLEVKPTRANRYINQRYYLQIDWDETGGI
jgi:hypothetical protein